VVIKQYDWLKECKGNSIMELEILHGALRNPGIANHAFFISEILYLGSIFDSIAEDKRINYV